MIETETHGLPITVLSLLRCERPACFVATVLLPHLDRMGELAGGESEHSITFPIGNVPERDEPADKPMPFSESRSDAW
jgi:hypothetical protein